MDNQVETLDLEKIDIYTGQVLRYCPQEPGQIENRPGPLLIPEPAVRFLSIAGDMRSDPTDVATACAELLATTNMPEAGWAPYSRGLMNVPLGVGEVEPVLPPLTPHGRASAICRIAVDVAVGPYSNLPIQSAANLLRLALISATEACDDRELAFYYLDEHIMHLEHYYLARVVMAADNLQNSLADMPARVASSMRLRSVLIQAGLQAEDYIPGLPEGYFGAGKPRPAIPQQLVSAIVQAAGVRP